MSWYRHKVERDLARWQTAGWVSEAGASAIRADLRLAQIGVRRGADLCHARRRAVRLRRHELRGRPLDGHVEARPARAAAGDAVGLLRRRRLPVPAPAQRLRPRRRARRHRRVRRLDHADRADVPHGGQPARRGAHVGARRAAGRRRCCAPTRRSPPRSCCWSCGPAWERGLSDGAHWGFLVAVGRDRGGGRLARLAPGPASRRASAWWCGWCRSATSCSTITRTGSWR